MATRDNEGAGITVHWDSDRCIHSERCFTGGPTIFDPRARPWVQPDGAPADEVARVVDTCPSGALSYTRTDGVPNGRRGHAIGEDPAAAIAPDPDPGPAEHPAPASDVDGAVTLTPRADGPLVLDGPVDLTAPDGSVSRVDKLFLCRCGQSATKPACDGSHKRVGFTAPGVAPTSRGRR